jgi:hypothetical protein
MKKIFLVAVLVFVSVVGFVVNSCESNTYSEISPVVINPTYTKDVGPIIRSTCSGCHGSNFPSLQNYAEVREATEKGDVICRIDNQSCGAVMPQSGRMPQVNINAIKTWAANGYPN